MKLYLDNGLAQMLKTNNEGFSADYYSHSIAGVEKTLLEQWFTRGIL